MLLDEQSRFIVPLFCHRPVTGRLTLPSLLNIEAGLAIGVAQIWMQILFKVAQFWMPFNKLGKFCRFNKTLDIFH